MPKFTDLNNDVEFKKSKKMEFLELLELLEDYIGNNFYGEVVQTPEQRERVFNTLEDLKNRYSEYEEAHPEDKHVFGDYYTEMYDVIDKLTEFAEGEN